MIPKLPKKKANELLKRIEEYENTIKMIEDKGYKNGTWIVDENSNIPLRIGYGLIWSEYQQAFVIGCMDLDNEYNTAVPIYRPKDNYWAKIIKI